MKIKKVSQPVAAVGQILNENSNSEKDTYSCDYINENVGVKSYSTDEVETGDTWTNGDPIYRKVIDNFTVDLSDGQQVINHNISNFKNLTDLKIYVKYSGTTFDLLSSGYIVRVSNSQIQINLMAQGIGLTGYTGYIIMEYTKTTE